MCSLSFDTRPALETHLHLAHTRVTLQGGDSQGPTTIGLYNVKTNPLAQPSEILPKVEQQQQQQQDLAQDLSIKREPTESTLQALHRSNDALLPQLLCPVSECNRSFSIPGTLADHMRSDHSADGASKCPHCRYTLTNDELSKDHWLTHHKDVCPACVHVFTAVYGPQLWKKVHVKSQPSESPLDAIVSGLSRKRTSSNANGGSSSASTSSDICQPPQMSPQSDISGYPSEPHSPSSENQDYDSERYSNSSSSSKRSRKQRCPKKVIAFENDEDEEMEEIYEENVPSHVCNEETKDITKFSEDMVTSKPLSSKEPKSKIPLVSSSSSMYSKHCLKCRRRPQFSSHLRLQTHKHWRHRRSKLLRKKRSSENMLTKFL